VIEFLPRDAMHSAAAYAVRLSRSKTT